MNFLYFYFLKIQEDKKEELTKEEKINNLTLEINKLKGEVQKCNIFIY